MICPRADRDESDRRQKHCRPTASPVTLTNKEEVMEFKSFPKIARLSRDIIVTEKIDGTNASVFIGENGEFLIGSRTRWITPEQDNYGFAKWANENKDELLKLGLGHHFGEWWGQGIQRKYGREKKIWSLFNTNKWSDDSVRPSCCDVTKVLYTGPFITESIEAILSLLVETGSVSAPGFMKPEGIVIFHPQGNILLKKTIEGDGLPKSLQVIKDQ